MDYAQNLLNYAKEMSRLDQKLAKKYIKSAITLLKKKTINVPNEWKIYYCKKCFYVLNPNNTKFRTHNKKLTIKCNNCGNIKRKILKK